VTRDSVVVSPLRFGEINGTAGTANAAIAMPNTESDMRATAVSAATILFGRMRKPFG
jgi:hypothetical protein